VESKDEAVLGNHPVTHKLLEVHHVFIDENNNNERDEV